MASASLRLWWDEIKQKNWRTALRTVFGDRLWGEGCPIRHLGGGWGRLAAVLVSSCRLGVVVLGGSTLLVHIQEYLLFLHQYLMPLLIDLLPSRPASPLTFALEQLTILLVRGATEFGHGVIEVCMGFGVLGRRETFEFLVQFPLAILDEGLEGVLDALSEAGLPFFFGFKIWIWGGRLDID